MNIEESEKIITIDDFHLLTNFIKTNKAIAADQDNSTIIKFIENATQVEEGDFPWDNVRLNSRVVIRDKMARLNYTYILVMPELADHKTCSVSVFSVIGRALFGSSRGKDIYWKTPKGKRYFTVMAVSQYALNHG